MMTKLRLLCFLFLFFFIVHNTYCSLIPNDRVIIKSDPSNEFNLVEGITYKIIHLKSGSYLNSENDDIYVSSSFNPYQIWSIRKGDNDEYNIVNAKTTMNLDSNTDKVYLGSEWNSVFNPHQRWVLKRIKNDTYNILHVQSGFTNLDSNGRYVYMGSHENSGDNNLYQHWSFKPINYKLNAEMIDFEYPPDLKDKLDRYKKRTNLFSGSILIRNPTEATIVEVVNKEETKSNSYTLKVKRSESFKDTKDIGFSFNIGKTILDLLGINTGFSGGIKKEFSSSYDEDYEESVHETIKYTIKEKITVPPYSSIMVNSSIDKIGIDIPFKAKIKITAKADRLDEYGRIVEMADVDVNALKYFVQKEYYDSKIITEEGNSIVISTRGNLKVDGYGVDKKVEAIPVDSYPKPNPCPNPPIGNPPNVPTDTSPSSSFPTEPSTPNKPNPPNPPTDRRPPVLSDPNADTGLIFESFAIYLLLIFFFFFSLIFVVYAVVNKLLPIEFKLPEWLSIRREGAIKLPTWNNE